MNILHVIPCFYPATYWGGPVFSTKAICDGVAARPDMSLRVLTTDTGGPHLSERVTPVQFAYPVHYARRISGDAFAPGMFQRLPRALVAQHGRERPQQPRRFDEFMTRPVDGEALDPADGAHQGDDLIEAGNQPDDENAADQAVQADIGEKDGADRLIEKP